MFLIEAKENWNLPRLFCNTCKKEIANAKAAMVVFPNLKENGTLSMPLFVHKNLVYGDCLSKAEGAIQEGDAIPGCVELTVFMAQLIANIGMDADAIGKVLDSEDA